MLRYENKFGNCEGMAEGRLAPAQFLPQEQYVSAPNYGADFLTQQTSFREIKFAPVDARGVPLSIIPSEDFYTHKKKTPALSKHHEFFLYGKRKFTSLGGVALRQSRVLWTESRVHNIGNKSFHSRYNQLEGPTDETGQFTVSLLNMAGYLPISGVDLWSGVPVIRRISDGEKEILNAIHPDDNSYANRYYSIQSIRPFLHDYITRQDISDIDPRVIDTFSSTSKNTLVEDLGLEILGEAIKKAVAPVESVYHQAKEAGQLHRDAPVSAERVVLDALGNVENRIEIFSKLKLRILNPVNTLQTGMAEEETQAA
jgi:hypothetical protein